MIKHGRWLWIDNLFFHWKPLTIASNILQSNVKCSYISIWVLAVNNVYFSNHCRLSTIGETEGYWVNCQFGCNRRNSCVFGCVYILNCSSIFSKLINSSYLSITIWFPTYYLIFIFLIDRVQKSKDISFPNIFHQPKH